MSTPLSAPIPLRLNAVWGSYQNLRAIPYCYGRVKIEPVAYDAAGLQFVLADHAIFGNVVVYRDDALYTLADFANTTDTTGHAIALMTLNERLAVGERLAVEFDGRIDPVSGGLMTNPAMILWDILANICGRSIQRSELTDLRVACQNEGMIFAGVVAEYQRSTRSYIDELMQSAGAVWSAGAMPGVAKFWPSIA